MALTHTLQKIDTSEPNEPPWPGPLKSNFLADSRNGSALNDRCDGEQNERRFAFLLGLG